jgi:gas vesicle protein
MENSRNTEKLVATLLIGAAIGGALGILFASDKGKELRKIIAGKTGDLTGTLKDKFNSILETSKKEFVEVKEKALDLVHAANKN